MSNNIFKNIVAVTFILAMVSCEKPQPQPQPQPGPGPEPETKVFVTYTLDAEDVGQRDARILGRLVVKGYDTDQLETGFYYSVKPEVDPLDKETDHVYSESIDTTYSFVADLDGLHESTTYYYKAYAKLGVLYSCGEIKSFKTGNTPAVKKFEVATIEAEDVGPYGARMVGMLDVEGYDTTSLKTGFYYSTKSAVDTLDKETVMVYSNSIDADCVFEAGTKVLNASTTYYFKAFARLDTLYSCGKVESFKTAAKPDPTGGPVWAELPSKPEKEGDYYYTWHYTDVNKTGSTTKARNYSVCYSKDKYCAMWIAAPYHDFYTGSSGRSDAYKSDPNFDFEQPGKWSGYTRGHLLGSSERTKSRVTNNQVFYYSNIAPQLQTYFNTGGGAWNDCEEWIEKMWSGKQDTTYVVTGCWWDPEAQPKVVSGTTIPTHYYKVILRTKNHLNKYVCNCTADELQCLVVFMPHKTYGKAHPVPPLQYESAGWLMSVSDLEAKTGFTYFTNVPNAPKGSYTLSDWGL